MRIFAFGRDTEHRSEPVPVRANPLLDQLRVGGQDADLALILVHVDANMLHGWPPLLAASTASEVVGPSCHHVERGQPLHPIYATAWNSWTLVETLDKKRGAISRKP